MNEIWLGVFGLTAWLLGVFFGGLLRRRMETVIFDYMTSRACVLLMDMVRELPANHEEGARLELAVDRWGKICVTSPPMSTGGEYKVTRKLTRNHD